MRTEHSLSIDGGGDHTNYFANINYLHENGQVKTTFFDRVSARLTQDTQIKDWLRFGNSLSITTSSQNIPNQEGTGFQSMIQWMYTIPSIHPIYRRDENGTLIKDNNGNLIYDYGNNQGSLNAVRPIFGNENTAGSLEYYDFKTERNSATINSYAEFDISKNLSFRTNASFEKYLFNTSQYTHYKYGFAQSVGGRVSEIHNTTTALNLIQQLTFYKNFNNHSIEARAIYESYSEKIQNLGAQGTGFLPGVKVLNGSTKPETVQGFTLEERIIGYLGQLRYNYNDTYFAELSYRKDASSRFKADNRWGDFYAVGASYMLSNADFLRLTMFHF